MAKKGFGKVGKISKMVLGFAGALSLLSLSVQQLFKFDVTQWLVAVFMIATGISLMLQGNYRLKFSRKIFPETIHRLSAIFGTAILTLGIITLPVLAGTSLLVITTFAGWITLIGALLSMIEVYV